MKIHKIFSLYFTISSLSVLFAQFPIEQVNSSSPKEGNQFGSDVSVFGNRIAISSPKDDHSGISSGSVEIYSLQISKWVFDEKIVADNPSAFEQFGYSVSLGDSILVVGAPHYGGSSGGKSRGPHSGAAYIFELDSSGWNQAQQLIPDDLSLQYNFGYSVEIHQNYIAIGAYNSSGNNTDNSGAVYMYKKENDTWVLDGQKIYPLDGKNGDRFGYSLSLSQSDKLYLLVGAYQHDQRKGAAYLFAKNISPNSFSKETPIQKINSNTLSRTRSNNTINKVKNKVFHPTDDWEQIHKFQPSDLNSGDNFGYSVSIDEDHLIVGSPMASGISKQTGAAYHYQKDSNGTWSQTNKLFSSNSKKHDQYGIKVDIESPNIYIGSSHYDGSNIDYGRIHTYTYLNELNEKNPILSRDQMSYNYFGLSFAADNQLFIVGSRYELGNAPSLNRGNTHANGYGTAYTYWPNLEVKPWGDALDTLWRGTTGYDTLVVHNYSSSIIGVSVDTDDSDFISFNRNIFQIPANGYELIPMNLNGNTPDLGANTTNINFIWSYNSVPNYSYSYDIEIVADLSFFDNTLPKTFALGNNYPNPFNPTTTIQYNIPKYSNVSIRIFDLRGRQVALLVDQHMNPGYFSVVWNGNQYSSGLYFVQMIAGQYVDTKKLMLIK